MKPFLTVILLALTSISFAQEEDLLQDPITRPALSIRCKELLKERDLKVRHEQKLQALLQRNRDLIKKTPRAKETLHARIEAHQLRVRNELHLTELQIQTQEENIIRSGCPGIALQ
ncbi:MAG: hypothetical protein ACJ76H_09750 [Bacteriovoracaceae bacterium]|jgi:hypothetical protein